MRKHPTKSIVLVSAVLLAAACISVSAGTPDADAEAGRFTFKETSDGLVRLDRNTGQVSICAKRTGGWACEAAADERAALDTEIGRLQDENAKLKQQLASRDAAPGAGSMLQLPSDADLDRAMTFLDKAWRRLGGIVQNAQKDFAGKGRCPDHTSARISDRSRVAAEAADPTVTQRRN